MTDRPIIFSSAMVRALLEGRKTQTRRLIKWKLRDPGLNLNFSGLHAVPLKTNGTPFGTWTLDSRGQGGCWEERGTVKTYAVGDRLYVRETWRPIHTGDVTQGAEFLADKPDGWRDQTVWRPAIHHPKKWSRITLTVTAVKVERLQDITEADAMAEGAEMAPYETGRVDNNGHPEEKGSYVAGFYEIWQSLNAERAPWDSNPWVVAVSFKADKCNIERMPG